MHSEHWPLKKLSACISLLALTSATGQSAFAEDWVISHPWIMADEYTPNPEPIGDLPNAFNSQDILGADGRPLKALYRPAMNSIIDTSETRLVLRTNIFSLTGDTAIAVSDGALDGIVIDDMTVWSFQDSSALKDPSKAAILIGPSGAVEPTLTGGISSSGNIKGGVYITGEAKPATGSVYSSVGTSDTGGKATLEGGFSVINGGVAESLSDHAVKLENHAYIDYITSGINSRITAKGENSSAVYVGEGGQLGGDYSFTHQIKTLQAVAGSDESNYLKADINNDGIVDDFDSDGKKDLYKIVDTALPDTISGEITNSEADTVVAVEGQINSDQSTAIKIDGTSIGKIHITPTGLLSGGLDNVNGDGEIDVPEKSVLWVRKTSTSTGNHTGTVFNEGTVTGGIFIHGTHTAPTDGFLYHGHGTSTDLAELQGGYTVKYGGQATADERAIYIDRHSSIENIRVIGEDIDTGAASLLSSTNSNAIYVEESGIIGNPASPTTPAILVSDGAELRGNSGVVVRGNVHGSIHIDDGTLIATASTGATAIDFANADSALLFKQTGSNAATTGSIVASASRNDDRVEILGGAFTGEALSGIDELAVSTGATVTVTGAGGFTLPAKTTLQIEAGFASSGPAIDLTHASGVLTVNESLITVKPGSLAAYRELTAAMSDTTIVVADGSSVSGNTDNISTNVEGLALNFVSDTGNLLKAKGAAISGNQLEVTVETVDPTSFANSLINASLNETDATLTAAAVSAIASSQTTDPVKAEALFQSLNSTTDFETLATQLAQPVEVTARSGIGAMNTTQNITLSEARGQINGFSYGDGFDWGEIWGQAIYSKSDQSTLSGKAGFEGKTNGYIIGAGLNLSNNWSVGLSGAMTTTTTNGDLNKDLKTTSYISSLYSNWDNGDWFFDSLLTLGLSKNDTQKYIDTHIGLEKVEADYDSLLWGARLVAGKQYSMGYWLLAPQLELNYGQVRFDKYTERGNSGWESTVKTSNYEVMELGGGFRANSTSWLARGSIRPELSIMGYYDFKQQGSQFESTYLAGGDPFVVTGAERDRFRIQSSFGISVDLLERLTINAAYNHNWSDHYKAHSFSAKANYKF